MTKPGLVPGFLLVQFSGAGFLGLAPPRWVTRTTRLSYCWTESGNLVPGKRLKAHRNKAKAQPTSGEIIQTFAIPASSPASPAGLPPSPDWVAKNNPDPKPASNTPPIVNAIVQSRVTTT